MTKWAEFPLRIVGQPWPGLNTRGGILDAGSGQLEDGSFNQIINEGDLLEKRNGFIRGLNERFDGPVCGLFKYTDNCGIEWLLVADQTQISVRQPFAVPVNQISDAYPVDDFEGDLDTDNWRGSTDYENFGGALRLLSAAASSTDLFPADSRILQWFKDASNTSYETQIQYEMSTTFTTLQVVSVVMKRSSGTYLIATISLDASLTYQVRMEAVRSGSRTLLFSSPLLGTALRNGFLKLGFNAQTRIATVTVTPSGGSIVTGSSEVVELTASSFGSKTGLGLSYGGAATAPDGLRILSVIAGPSL